MKLRWVSTRLRALRDLLESLSRAEDIVKVYEARLTEKETTSLTPSEVEDYVLTLKVGLTPYYKLKDCLDDGAGLVRPCDLFFFFVV